MSICIMILRCVKNEKSDKMWKTSYHYARKSYPDDKIVVVDDNSSIPPIVDSNTFVVNSEYHGRGELLPYIYFYRNKYADKAIIIHDSVILNGKLDTQNIYTYQFLWNFGDHVWDHDHSNITLLFPFGQEAVDLYMRKFEWKGMFGSMSVITHDYLSSIVQKHNFLDEWVHYIKDRGQRMNLERSLAILFIHHDKEYPAIFGDIFDWPSRVIPGRRFEGITLDDWENLVQNGDEPNIFKIWLGR